jgi:hypothetical protein
MDYELAKDLRNAGFPQGGAGRWIGSPKQIVWRSHDRVYFPTLEELIAACGEKFDALMYREHNKTWSAAGEDFEAGGHLSPDAAVAHLWLALISRRGRIAGSAAQQ